MLRLHSYPLYLDCQISSRLFLMVDRQWEVCFEGKRLLRDAYISTVLRSFGSTGAMGLLRDEDVLLVSLLSLLSLFSLSLPRLLRGWEISSLGLGVFMEMRSSVGTLVLESRFVFTRTGWGFSSATRANGLESLPRGLTPFGGFDRR